jgi:hypothetical protein
MLYDRLKGIIDGSEEAGDGTPHMYSSTERDRRNSHPLDHTEPLEVESDAGIMEPRPSKRPVCNSSKIFLPLRPLTGNIDHTGPL